MGRMCDISTAIYSHDITIWFNLPAWLLGCLVSLQLPCWIIHSEQTLTHTHTHCYTHTHTLTHIERALRLRLLFYLNCFVSVAICNRTQNSRVFLWCCNCNCGMWHASRLWQLLKLLCSIDYRSLMTAINSNCYRTVLELSLSPSLSLLPLSVLFCVSPANQLTYCQQQLLIKCLNYRTHINKEQLIERIVPPRAPLSA